MALKNLLKFQTYEGTTDIALEARSGESLLVTGVYINYPNDTFAELTIDKATVGYYAVNTGAGSHLLAPGDFDPNRGTIPGGAEDIGYKAGGRLHNLLDWFVMGQMFPGYPVAEGEVFRITMGKQAGGKVILQYSEYDAGDMTSEMMNGSKSMDYLFVNYGHTGATYNTAGDITYDTQVSPAEFPAFPFGDNVPANHEITILAIAGIAIGVYGAAHTDYTKSKYLKLTRNREVLFDELRAGIPFFGYDDGASTSKLFYGGGTSPIHWGGETDRDKPFKLPEPLKFVAGDELQVQVTVEVGGAPPSVTTADQLLGLISMVHRTA